MAIPDSDAPAAVSAGVRALLAAIIDYAGLFPPADLALDDALPRYLRDRQGEDAWMLSRFVLPVGRLGDLDAFADELTDAAADEPVRLSVLPTGGPDGFSFLQAWQDDLQRLLALQEQFGGRVVADQAEVRIPPTMLDAGPLAVQRLLENAGLAIANHDLDRLDAFFEIPLDERHEDLVPVAVEGLAAFNDACTHDGEIPCVGGLKLRCGGLTPEAVPQSEALARAITACRKAGVRFKATAGLHHPVRHHAEDVGTDMHGFLNVFGGAALAYTHELDAITLLEILEETDADAFTLNDDGFAWQGLAASPEQLAEARRHFAISFGSCSFDEPREDLRALGWL